MSLALVNSVSFAQTYPAPPKMDIVNAAVAAGSFKTLTAAVGAAVKVRFKNGVMVSNGFQVLSRRISATNGVIFVIDTVLMPN